jgi:heme a synthase
MGAGPFWLDRARLGARRQQTVRPLRLDPFQRLALGTTAATYLLIAVGGLVRASGAGLGCPDWPRCFDRWIPPVDRSGVPDTIDPDLFNFTLAWTEYLNRLLGVVVGLLIFATAVAAVRLHRRNPRVLLPTLSAFVAVGVQGWLGGQVVESGLSPWVLTAHLVLALGIVSLLLYASVSAFFPSGVDGPSVRPDPERRRWAFATGGVIGLLLVQVGLGAGVRAGVQQAAEAGLSRAEWIDALGAVESVHRSFAVGLGLAVLALATLIRQRLAVDRWLRRSMQAATVLLIVQIGAGIGMSEWGVPPVLQVVHLWGAALLLGALTVQWLLLLRHAPQPAPAGDTGEPLAQPGHS